ncbi:MAG: VacJ family lipoprotein [Elusimicrobiota bacterium]
MTPLKATLFGCLAFSLALGGAPARAAEPPSSPEAGSEPSVFDEFEDEFEFDADGAEPKKVFDPLRGYNRFMFKVNDKLFYWLLKPAGKAYAKVVPEQARTAFGRAFHNLHFGLRFSSSLLQLKFKKAGTELGRFVVNSTVGVGGLFDPADKLLHWRTTDEDFGQMLGHYGVGGGFPVVLPVIGQTNLRDGLGMVPNYLLNPVTYVADFQTNFMVGAGEHFNFASLHLDEYEAIKKDALDPYTFLRDAYKQHRDKKIKE